jgi:hypothetical protein
MRPRFGATTKRYSILNRNGRNGRNGEWAPGAIQSDALTLRIFRDMAGFDHGGLLEISLRVRYLDDYRRETEREFQGPPKELPITPRR